MLAGAGAGARQQGGGDGLGRDDPGELVRQDGAHQARPLPIRAGLHRGEARHRLDQRIVDRLVRVGAVLAEAADRHVDDRRRHRADRRLADADALGDAGPEILHEDVGPRR